MSTRWRYRFSDRDNNVARHTTAGPACSVQREQIIFHIVMKNILPIQYGKRQRNTRRRRGGKFSDGIYRHRRS